MPFSQQNTSGIPPNTLEENTLFQIISSKKESEARTHLCQALEARAIAGAIFFQINQINDAFAPEIRTVWDHDFSGALANGSPHMVLEDVVADTPKWLIRKLGNIIKPFWLGHYLRFIPFSGLAMLKLTGRDGVRPLGDMVISPYTIANKQFILVCGLYEPATRQTAEELSMLATAYMSRVTLNDAQSICDAKATRSFTLSDTQLECLSWMAAGKSLQEIAIITDMSYANVRYHLEKAKRDSGYVSMQQVLVHAARSYDLSPMGPLKK